MLTKAICECSSHPRFSDSLKTKTKTKKNKHKREDARENVKNPSLPESEFLDQTYSNDP